MIDCTYFTVSLFAFIFLFYITSPNRNIYIKNKM